MRATGIVVALSIAVATAGLAACGSDSGSSTAPAGDAAAQSAPANGAAGDGSAGDGSAARAQFGTGCGAIPASGPGSSQGMASDPVATAASHNPVLSRLFGALQKANLVDSLNNAQNITVFAPANAAFEQLPGATLDRIVGDNAKLAKILTYHVVGRRVAPAELGAGNFASLEGATVSTSGSGQDFKINGNATVICGNVQTANATVYIIDSLLQPPTK